MNDEMVERVARAILAGHDWTTDMHGEDGGPLGWEALQEDWQEAYRNMARAAIAAMQSEAVSSEKDVNLTADEEMIKHLKALIR